MSNRQNAQPSLRALSFALRHKELWPAGFEWNYSSCAQCAMGLAHAMWSNKVPAHDLESMTTAFNMNRKDADRIFLRASRVETIIDARPITPERIADLIDAL
jgi:hypothetical protein